MLAPRTVAKWCGLAQHDFLPLYGLREIASGVGILNSKKPATWLWSRVAGDGQDLATLCESLDDVGYCDRAKLCATILAVTGITVLDTLAAVQTTIEPAIEPKS